MPRKRGTTKKWAKEVEYSIIRDLIQVKMEKPVVFGTQLIYHDEGVYIKALNDGAPATVRAKLQPDDIITHLDGETMTEPPVLIMKMKSLPQGSPIHFTVLRLDTYASGLRTIIVLKEKDQSFGLQLRLDQEKGVVVVEEILDNAAFELKHGLRKGFKIYALNGVHAGTISSTNEVYDIFTKIPEGGQLTLTLDKEHSEEFRETKRSRVEAPSNEEETLVSTHPCINCTSQNRRCDRGYPTCRLCNEMEMECHYPANATGIDRKDLPEVVLHSQRKQGNTSQRGKGKSTSQFPSSHDIQEGLIQEFLTHYGVQKPIMVNPTCHVCQTKNQFNVYSCCPRFQQQHGLCLPHLQTLLGISLVDIGHQFVVCPCCCLTCPCPNCVKKLHFMTVSCKKRNQGPYTEELRFSVPKKKKLGLRLEKDPHTGIPCVSGFSSDASVHVLKNFEVGDLIYEVNGDLSIDLITIKSQLVSAATDKDVKSLHFLVKRTTQRPSTVKDETTVSLRKASQFGFSIQPIQSLRKLLVVSISPNASESVKSSFRPGDMIIRVNGISSKDLENVNVLWLMLSVGFEKGVIIDIEMESFPPALGCSRYFAPLLDRFEEAFVANPHIWFGKKSDYGSFLYYLYKDGVLPEPNGVDLIKHICGLSGCPQPELRKVLNMKKTRIPRVKKDYVRRDDGLSKSMNGKDDKVITVEIDKPHSFELTLSSDPQGRGVCILGFEDSADPVLRQHFYVNDVIVDCNGMATVTADLLQQAVKNSAVQTKVVFTVIREGLAEVNSSELMDLESLHQTVTVNGKETMADTALDLGIAEEAGKLPGDLHSIAPVDVTLSGIKDNVIILPQIGESPAVEVKLGETKVLKEFPGHGMFLGTVMSRSDETGLFIVVYEDGDSEEMPEAELRVFVVSDQMELHPQDKSQHSIPGLPDPSQVTDQNKLVADLSVHGTGPKKKSTIEDQLEVFF